NKGFKRSKTGNKRNKTAEYVTGSKEIKDSKEAKPVTREAKTAEYVTGSKEIKAKLYHTNFCFFYL
ncbi:MAG: hypothetical protein J6P57_02180, partial [Lachnospiraceae bacterium]|nr:hypothetical protein [Lachnospiraceae bacterium]